MGVSLLICEVNAPCQNDKKEVPPALGSFTLPPASSVTDVPVAVAVRINGEAGLIEQD
jgi:hypothetical protein